MVVNPQLDNEVRGVDNLRLFGGMLFNGYTPEWEKKEDETPTGETPSGETP